MTDAAILNRPNEAHAEAIYLHTGETTLSDLNAEEIRNRLKRFGYVIFSGFGVSQQEWTEFANRFSGQSVIHGGNRKAMSEDDTVQDVTKGLADVPAHVEMGRMPQRPDLAWFYCAQPASEGGESTLYDGIEVLKELPESVRTIFSKKIRYVATMPKEYWRRAWQVDTIEDAKKVMEGIRSETPEVDFCIHQDGSFTGSYSTFAIQRTRWGREYAFANSIFGPYTGKAGGEVEIEGGEKIDQPLENKLRETLARCEIVLPLRKGDFIMIDNSRVMHGRKAILSNKVQRKMYASFTMANF